MAIYGYARVSTADQAADDKTSLETQRRKINAVADMNDLIIERIFEEPGVSGAKPLATRPAGAELVAALRPGDTLIVAKLDRAFRSASDALRMADTWKTQGVALILADMGTSPITDNGTAKFFFNMLAIVADFERTTMAERMMDGRRGKKARGGHAGGQPQYGYKIVGSGRDSKLEPVESEQAAIAIIRQYAGDMTLRTISGYLHHRGYDSRAGRPFSAVQVARIIKQNPPTAGAEPPPVKISIDSDTTA